MVAQTSFDADVFRSVLNPFQAYFEGLDRHTQGYAPLMEPFKVVARCQLEAMGLINRRAQAYLAVPSRLAGCRTPQDLAREQVQFWQTAFAHYSESSQRMVDAWSKMASSMQAAGSGPRGERDYITFPTTKEPPVPHRTIRLQESRRRVA